ncbi:unnamed protein product [Paramecium octaurelia]|uniref:Uncharacterized protein n=1 Tax=Paramecium octaurelia TaxID=43137 RepID=A0A8S1U2T6_PAROT|nr:unnamed protein product [Paramecium octaurelia]
MDVQLQKILDSNYKGKTLYNHFCEIYYQIQENKYYKAQSWSDFEDLSNFIKENRFYHIQQSQILNIQPLKTAEQIKYSHDKSIQINAKVINVALKNFLKLNALLNNVGDGFTDEDVYFIQQSLKSIAIRDINIFNIRFWGNLFHKRETIISQMFYCPKHIRNLNLLIAMKNLMNMFIKLLRTIIIIIKSNSTAGFGITALSNTQINGSEQVYDLCVQWKFKQRNYSISSIRWKGKAFAKSLNLENNSCESNSTQFYRYDEDTKQVTFEDEFKMPESAELSTMDGWAHLPPNILKQGRITFYEDPSLKEEELNQMNEADPELERLKSIKDDKLIRMTKQYLLNKMKGTGALRFLEKHNNILIRKKYLQVIKQSYQEIIYGLCNYCQQCIYQHEILSQSNDFISIYFGYGNKNQQNSFNPLAPNDVQEEPEDVDEIPEPNPREQPDDLEPDSDVERRREQERREAESQQQQE